MISLRRVNVHNLKNIDIDLPTGKLLVFCGRSGSGKSSLVLDTIHAEGQRRYIETFSPAMRQFLEKIEKPDAERLDGIPPSVAISLSVPENTETTVGTVTELTDYLTIYLQKQGHLFCPQCRQEIKIDTPENIAERYFNEAEKKAPLNVAFEPPPEDSPAQFAEYWKEQGFLRGMSENTVFRLDEPVLADLYRPGLLIIVDRIKPEPENRERFIESLETAMNFGNGICCVIEKETKQIFSKRLVCDEHGTRPGDDVNNYHLNNHFQSPNLADLSAMPSVQLAALFSGQKKYVPSQIISRLNYLHHAGLGYLTLARQIGTLSDGEQRRIALTSALGSSLVEMLYVLDEPSLGLHPKDCGKLLTAIQQLRDRGNSVILIEHEPLLIQNADQIVEIGPGGGENGGEVVFQGTVEELLKDKQSLTVKYLNQKPPVKTNHLQRSTHHSQLTIAGCTGHNLKNIDVTFPLGGLCVVTGVSGAGKSSLVRQTLYPALCRHLGKKCGNEALPYRDLQIPDADLPLNDVLLIDRTPAGKTTSSNPATYLKIFDEIRSVFAGTVDAKTKNITARHFSFNVTSGRCEHCKGNGVITVDMQFLPDKIIRCPECRGKRYQPQVLDILYRGKNIAEVLEMTARETFSFFRGQGKVQKGLKRLLDAGLDYIRIGQPTSTLSGGELQRLKLAAYLSGLKSGRTLILLDEPAAGLHFADTEVMNGCFRSLIQAGHSLIVIEHNRQVIDAADWQIELGPEGGENGGELMSSV